jgi:hypothetical protein
VTIYQRQANDCPVLYLRTPVVLLSVQFSSSFNHRNCYYKSQALLSIPYSHNSKDLSKTDLTMGGMHQIHVPQWATYLLRGIEFISAAVSMPSSQIPMLALIFHRLCLVSSATTSIHMSRAIPSPRNASSSPWSGPYFPFPLAYWRSSLNVSVGKSEFLGLPTLS